MKILFILCNILVLFDTIALYAGTVSMGATKFNGDSGNSGALLGEYKSLADKGISIAFVIAAVPVLFAIVRNTPQAKKAVIGYIVAIIAYYGVIQKII